MVNTQKSLRRIQVATIRKRGNKFQVQIRLYKDYRLISESKSFSSKLEAIKWAEIRENQIKSNIENKLDASKTLREAIERYRDIITPEKRGAQWETLRINAMLRNNHLPLDRLINSITTDELAHWRRQLPVSPASKNRVTTILRSIFEVARLEWKWLAENPLKDLKRLPEPQARDRRINDYEISLICEELEFDLDNPDTTTQKQKIGLIFLFAIETAMRQSEITKLQWERVNLKDQFLTLIETKNGYKRHVPLSSKAVSLLKIMNPQRSGDIFGIDADTVSTLFRRAVKKCKIENLRFHDTRHEACTRLAQLLEPLDLARMIGHRDLKSLMIYYNPTPTEIAKRLG